MTNTTLQIRPRVQAVQADFFNPWSLSATGGLASASRWQRSRWPLTMLAPPAKPPCRLGSGRTTGGANRDCWGSVPVGGMHFILCRQIPPAVAASHEGSGLPMANLGWFGIFMAFHRCKDPKAATLVLTNALRSDYPIGKSDREMLAQLIEGSDKPLFESGCEIEVRRRRSRAREMRQNAKYEALAEVHNRVQSGVSVEVATGDVAEQFLHLGFEAETLRKAYPGYKRAIFVDGPDEN